MSDETGKLFSLRRKSKYWKSKMKIEAYREGREWCGFNNSVTLADHMSNFDWNIDIDMWLEIWEAFN